MGGKSEGDPPPRRDGNTSRVRKDTSEEHVTGGAASRTHRSHMGKKDTRRNTPFHVVVVGGGFAGRRAARVLLGGNDEATCTVIDEKGYFEFVPSNLRCLVEPEHAEKIVMPHHVPATLRNRLRTWMAKIAPRKAHSAIEEEKHHPHEGRVKFVKGKATQIDFRKRRVVLNTDRKSAIDGDEKHVAYDYCIVCTGSTYASPIKGTGTDSESVVECRRQEIKAAASRLANAATVAVVGGGTVGVELAAEIAGAFPRQKQVTLVSGSATLLSRMPPAAGKYAARWLTKHGVSVLLGQKVAKEEDSYLITTEGRKVRADMIFKCTGGQPVDGLLHVQDETSEERPPVHHSLGYGECSVNPFLQIEQDWADGRVFVAGDCVPGGNCEKTAFMADLQATAAAQNILSCQSGRSMAPFPQAVCFGKPVAPRLAFVSLYKYSGIFQVNDTVIGGPLAALGKYVLEWLQIRAAEERIFSHSIFSALEAASVLAAVTLFGK